MFWNGVCNWPDRTLLPSDRNDALLSLVTPCNMHFSMIFLRRFPNSSETRAGSCRFSILVTSASVAISSLTSAQATFTTVRDHFCNWNKTVRFTDREMTVVKEIGVSSLPRARGVSVICFPAFFILLCVLFAYCYCAYCFAHCYCVYCESSSLF